MYKLAREHSANERAANLENDTETRNAKRQSINLSLCYSENEKLNGLNIRV